MEKYFNENTPIEIHTVSTNHIYVKREDLYGQFPAPPLGKLRGLRSLLNKYNKNGITTVGCWDTRVSKLGQGLAVCVKEFYGMRAIVSFPKINNAKTPESITQAAALGAEIYPVPGGRINICYSISRKYLESLGGIILPFGLECSESVEAIKREAQKTPIDYIKNGTLVACCGSGVTLAGIILGLPIKPKKIIGISSGRSKKNILKCLNKYIPSLPNSLEIIESMIPYNTALPFACPFPCHPNYDLKAWKYLVENINKIDSPILFWNIGA
jgi:1-aminocyclopropane-1-carboxylate deaminase/D-cysteine desulfhydrase-like pyridoxal-dependent ACC family enzyme